MRWVEKVHNSLNKEALHVQYRPVGKCHHGFTEGVRVAALQGLLGDDEIELVTSGNLFCYVSVVESLQ